MPVNYSGTSTGGNKSTVSPVRPSLNTPRKSSTDGVARTKILLLGLRRSGKTSVQQVIFNNLPPKSTFLSLEPTSRIIKHKYERVLFASFRMSVPFTPTSTVIPLEIWDCPGNITVGTLGAELSQFSSIVFVIDIRDLYNQPISKLVEFIVAAYPVNPDINIEVFVHKAERLQEDDKIENFRQIDERVTDRLLDVSSEHEQIPRNFYLTSVYDHSLHEAFSRVLQNKLIGSLPYLEELMNAFCTNCQSPKAFLFDVNSRLFIATNASSVDSATHNLCCDYLQMLNSFGSLYKSVSASPGRNQQEHSPSSTPPTSTMTGLPSSTSPPTPSTVTENSAPPTTNTPEATATRETQVRRFYPSAATSLHSSTPGMTLTYHLITPQLALLALLPTSVYELRRGLVEYNIVFFREGVQEIWVVEKEARGVYSE